MVLPVRPQVLDRIQFRSVGRQKLQPQPPALLTNEVPNHPAAVTLQAIPDDQQLAPQMAQQVAKEVDHLRAANRTGVEAKIEIPPSHPRHRRQRLPVKRYCSTGVCPRGAQVRQRCGLWLNPLSSMKTIVRPSFFAFFLTPASASASIAGSSLRPAPVPVRQAVGSSIPVVAESATHGRRGSGPRILSRSGGRPAPTSTDRSRSPELAALA